MAEYIVTLEIKTPFWKKLFRFFRLIKQREEVTLILDTDLFKEGDILSQFDGEDLLILRRKV